METTNLVQSYSSEPLKWYSRQLVAKMDRVLSVENKPKRDWKQQFVDAQDKFVSTLNSKFEKVDKTVEQTDWKETIS